MENTDRPAAQVRVGLYALAALLGFGAVLLLLHDSKYPVFWRYSMLYLWGLGAYFLVILTVLALAKFAAVPLGRLLAVRFVQAAMLLVGACVATLLVVEGVLVLLPERLWNLDPSAVEGPIFARQEPPLHHLRPANKQDVIVSPHGEFRVEVRINSDNLRDVERPVTKPPGVTRILILGDSMVEAVQVPLEQTFTRRTERLLAATTGRAIDVINTGVASYSPTAEYLMLRYKGLKYRPDVVVMAFFLADVSDDWAYRKDLLIDALGVPIERRPRDESVRANLAGTLMARSRLLKFRLGNLALLRANPLSDLAVSIFQPEYTVLEHEAWKLTKAAIAATSDLARAHGAEFVLMTLPYAVQVSPREGVAGSRRLKVPDFLRTSTKPQQVLAEFAAEKRMDYLDLLPTLRNAGVHPLFFDYDMHFTPKGHEVVARALASFLLDCDLVRKAAGSRSGCRGAEAA